MTNILLNFAKYMNGEEFWSLKLLKLKYRRGRNNSTFLQNWFSPRMKIPPTFILLKFQKSQKGTPESCRMHWNLMNYKESGSLNLSKLKYKRRDQIIQPFCRIGSSQELRFPLFNLCKYEKSENNILNDADCSDV